MINQWSPWTEPSSGLSMSCVTEEPSTYAQPCMTSPGSSTTLWMLLGSCWSVWQLWYSSSQNVASYVAIRLLTWVKRRKKSSHIEAWGSWEMSLSQLLSSIRGCDAKFFPLKQDCFRSSLKSAFLYYIYVRHGRFHVKYTLRAYKNKITCSAYNVYFVIEMLSPTTFTELNCGSQNSSGHKMFENTSLNISYLYKCPACSDFIWWTISFLVFNT